MKIIILNGSPRKDGNTNFLINSLKDGAKEKHNVEILNIAHMKINGCMACEYCHNEGNGICIQNDDMKEISPIINEADMIVIASPIYYWSLSGQMQSVITRFYATGKPKKAKKYALIMSSGSDDVYNAPISQYKDMLEYFGCSDMGIYKYFGDNQKSEENHNEMYNFGKSL